MTPGDEVLLLCFRATGHYWPLAFRTLALPVGCSGESFPYRRPFVFGKISRDIPYQALICMKYDRAESGFDTTTYIPLRWATDCRLLSQTKRDLLTFAFTVDRTVHYQAVASTADPDEAIPTKYSRTVRSAVIRAMRAAGKTHPLDGDAALAIVVDGRPLRGIYPPTFDNEAERWVNLTRLLSSNYLPGGGSLSKRTVFTRLITMKYLELDGKPDPYDAAAKRFRLYAHRDVELEIQSVSYPETDVPLTLHLDTNPDEVTTIVGESSLHPGTWIHRFTLTPRAVTDYTLLSFRTDGVPADAFATDFTVPAYITPLHSMEVIDTSDADSILCTYHVSDDDAKQPRKGQYLLAHIDDARRVQAVLTVDDITQGDTPDRRQCFLRLIGTTHRTTVKHWDGSTLAGESAPATLRVDLDADVQPSLKALCRSRDPGARCELLQVPASGTHFDLNTKQGFKNIHTAVFGQTGSGKSYSVGVVLEELLANGFKLLVLDPNSDFIHFAQKHPETFASHLDSDYRNRGRAFLKAGWASKIRVFTNRLKDRKRYWRTCKLSFSDLHIRQQAGLVHLDRDQIDLYSEHKKAHEQMPAPYGPGDFQVELAKTAELSPESGRRKLAALYSNYELDGMGIWDQTGNTVIHELERFYKRNTTQMMVVDLGSVQNLDARLLIAGNILEKLWTLSQDDRKPVVIVVDEAHNLVPPQPQQELQVVTTDILNRIAAEGRKYGLNLLLMTQRPSKLHPNSLGMLSNLVCMKVTNNEDLIAIRTVFGNVPASLLQRIPNLSKGEALVSGKLVPFPMLLKFGKRFTREGIKEP